MVLRKKEKKYVIRSQTSLHEQWSSTFSLKRNFDLPDQTQILESFGAPLRVKVSSGTKSERGEGKSNTSVIWCKESYMQHNIALLVLLFHSL